VLTAFVRALDRDSGHLDVIQRSRSLHRLTTRIMYDFFELQACGGPLYAVERDKRSIERVFVSMPVLGRLL
jgi:hypothetical protein